MDYTILKRKRGCNSKRDNKWSMSTYSEAQLYRSYGDALAKAKRKASECTEYEYMVCEMQTSVVADNVKVTDLRPQAINNSINSGWF